MSFADVFDERPTPQEIELADGATSLDFLRQVYRNASLPLPTRMRAAGMAIQFEHAKLAVTAMVTSDDFAIQLDRAIERSRMIETKPTTNVTVASASTTPSPHVQASNGGGKPPTIIDRRYRRW